MFITTLSFIHKSFVDSTPVLNILSKALGETNEVEQLVANIEHSANQPITELKYGRILSNGDYECNGLAILVPHTLIKTSEPTLTIYLYPFDILGIVLDMGGEQTHFMTQLDNLHATTIRPPKSSRSSGTDS